LGALSLASKSLDFCPTQLLPSPSQPDVLATPPAEQKVGGCYLPCKSVFHLLPNFMKHLRKPLIPLPYEQKKYLKKHKILQECLESTVESSYMPDKVTGQYTFMLLQVETGFLCG
jgi:hypothetical protein